MTKAEMLWERLLDLLDQEGLLFHQAIQSTPAEIANHVRSKTGDTRIHRFVWSYYYPRTFGNMGGSLTDLDAEALVDSYNRPLTKQERLALERENKPVTKNFEPPMDACRICGKRETAIVEAIT